MKKTSISYRSDDEAIPEAAGEGMAFVVDPSENAMQFSLFWTDCRTNERHTVLITSSDTELFEGIGQNFLRTVAELKSGHKCQGLIELGRNPPETSH